MIGLFNKLYWTIASAMNFFNIETVHAMYYTVFILYQSNPAMQNEKMIILHKLNGMIHSTGQNSEYFLFLN